VIESLWSSWEALTLHILAAGLLLSLLVAALWVVIVLPLMWWGIKSGNIE